MTFRVYSPALLALTAVLVACGGGRNAGRDMVERHDNDPLLARELATDGRVVEYLDTNLDGVADVEKYFEVLDEDGIVVEEPDPARWATMDRRLVERRMDINYDGAADAIRMYSPQGDLTSVQMDTDFDGVLDRTERFNDGVLTERHVDTDGNGRDDLVRYYRDDRLHRLEQDTDGDGEPDEWHFYDERGLQRMGFDQNRDGEIDRWVRRPMEGDAPPPINTGAAPGGQDADGSGDVADAPQEGSSDVPAPAAMPAPAEGSGELAPAAEGSG